MQCGPPGFCTLSIPSSSTINLQSTLNTSPCRLLVDRVSRLVNPTPFYPKKGGTADR